MRIALFSDIHGHITGLRAVLARLQQLGGSDAIYCLGDYIGGGPGLDDVIDVLIEHNVRLIRGNWDEIFLGIEKPIAKIVPERRENYQRTAEWMLKGLSNKSQNLLASLPICEEIQLSNHHRLLLCHATPTDTTARVCQADTPIATLRAAYASYDAQLIAYGHYHSQHVLQMDDKLLINAASIGLGWKGLSALTVVQATDESISIQQYHVPYDVYEHERLIRERNMPEDPAIWYW